MQSIPHLQAASRFFLFDADLQTGASVHEFLELQDHPCCSPMTLELIFAMLAGQQQPLDEALLDRSDSILLHSLCFFNLKWWQMGTSTSDISDWVNWMVDCRRWKCNRWFSNLSNQIWPPAVIHYREFSYGLK